MQQGRIFASPMVGSVRRSVAKSRKVARSTGHDRFVVAEVAREIDHPSPHVLLLKIERDIQLLIRRPIIHENDLEIGGDLLDFSAHPPVKLIDVGGRLVHCGDD